MCNICHQSPCHPRCPNAPDPLTVFECSDCSHEIYEGETYWELLGEQHCAYCIDEALTEVEEDTVCVECDEIIYAGEDGYNIKGRILCPHCVAEGRREARIVFDEEFYFDIRDLL